MIINNYVNCELYNEEEDQTIILKIEEENRTYIRNNINILKELDINLSEEDFIDKNIDDLYKEIIQALIKKEKLIDYDYSYNILDQLHFQKVPICFYDTPGISESNDLLDTLDIFNDYIKKYIINTSEDMNNINKINFHYLLLKFVLKGPFYIYQIPLLYQAHNKIIEILKEKQYYSLTSLTQKDLIERVDYIIEKLCDSEYYYNKYLSKKNKSSNIGPNNPYNNIKLNILKDSEAIFYIIIEKKKNPVIKEMIFKCENKEMKYEDIINFYNKDISYDNNNIKLNKNYFSFLEYLNNLENIIKTQISTIEVSQRFELHLEFKTEEESINNDNIFKMNVKYSIFNHPIYKESSEFLDENILEKNNKLEGFNSLMKVIDLIKDSSLYNSQLSTVSTLMNSNISNQLSSLIINNETYSNLQSIVIVDPNRFKIIAFSKQIYKHEENVKFFLPLKNGFFFSCGDGGEMILYNPHFDIINKIKNLGNILYDITEKESNDPNYIHLIACYSKNIYLIKIKIKENNNEYESKKYEIPRNKPLFCIESGVNYIMGGINFIMSVLELFNDKSPQKKVTRLSSESFYKCVILNDDYIAAISNDLIPNGSNKLSIINIKTNKVESTNSNYSFTYNENCAYVLNHKDKILLFIACKSNNTLQQNGICIVNMESNNISDLKYKFFDTENFEVYCFCKIYLYENQEKNVLIIFFFAGGFDLDERQGVVRLYKLIIKKNINIKFLQEIEIGPEYDDNFEGFDMPVNSITQSQKTGEIVITTIDGGVYLFSKPNIDIYINLDKNISK